MSQATYPTDDDVRSLLVGAGLISTPLAKGEESIDITTARIGAIEAWERDTGLVPFLKDANDVTLYYDPPGQHGNEGIFGAQRGGGRSLYLPSQGNSVFSSVTSVVIGFSTTNAGTLLTENREYWLEPRNAALNSRPYEFITFAGRQFGGPNSIVVTGPRGYPTVPGDVWRAIAEKAGAIVLPSLIHRINKGLVAWSESESQLKYSEKPLQAQREAWEADYKRVVARYVIE